jgi:CRP/FNR family cyclic AMP-dependent transcriptional regulator
VQGDKARLSYIQSGKVKITTVSAQGKKAVVAILSTGDFFGQGCMTGQPLRISSARTLAGSALWRLDKAAVTHALHAQPAFSELFMAYLLARNARIESDLIDDRFKSSEKWLARQFLSRANFGKDGEPLPIITPISQETLTTIKSVGRQLFGAFMRCRNSRR